MRSRAGKRSIDSLVAGSASFPRTGAGPGSARDPFAAQEMAATDGVDPGRIAAFALLLAGGRLVCLPAPSAADAHPHAGASGGFQLLSADLRQRCAMRSGPRSSPPSTRTASSAFRPHRSRHRQGSGLCIGRDDPARRQHHPRDHPANQRAVGRDPVVRHLQLRRNRSWRRSRGTLRSMPARSSAAACSAPRPIASRCPTNVLKDYLQLCQGHWDPNIPRAARRWSRHSGWSLPCLTFPGGGRRSPAPIGRWL